ncbi:peptide chain release factor N(5)-glutamine methyltransferase [Candidatus Bandiella numerosa]|uniref:peptide chain release factor N(5)-glutamine methyltransferase n=1 Tax=Candidatus Bandiella numerosa TaxID=2570586 RepID=UPI001F00B105
MKIDKITVSVALNNAQKILWEVGIETYKLDAKILLSHILNLADSENLIFQLNEKISPDTYSKYIKLVERRLKFEPVAYIIGSKCFWKQNYTINNNVLIPRPETELIIELILKKLTNKIDAKLNILDLGTGSGCIILSLLSELKFSIGLGIDISEEALNIARFNAKKFDMDRRVNFKISNWFSDIENTDQFDIIISNPPYITIDDWQNLEPSVLNYEPKNALTDHNDGVENYRIIAKNAKTFLKKDGIIILEMGFNQSKKIREIFKAKGYEIEIFKDLQSIDRIAIIRNGS